MVKKSKRSLSARYQQSYATKDSGSNNSIFQWAKADNEVRFFTPKEGRNMINIVPYEIKSKNHPLVQQGIMKIGNIDYVMDVWVHRSIGPNQMDVVCLRKNYNKACPICEAMDEAKAAGNRDEMNALKPRRRVFYNVINVNEPDGEIMVFETSHFNFEKELIEEAREQSDDQNIVDFADIDNGCVIEFRGSKAKFEGFEYMEFKSFRFRERGKGQEVTEEDVERAVSFDAIMTVLSYDQIKKILYGGGVWEEEEDADDDDDMPKEINLDDLPDENEDEDEDEDEDPPFDDDEEEEDDEEEDDEEVEELEEKPKKFGKKGSASPAKDKGRSKDKAGKGRCPYGHIFGEDNDEYKDCDDCPCWEECCAAS